MSKSLVIVESPSKARTINKYLGPDFIVEASVGHVKDLPKAGLAIDIDGGFVPTYEVIRGKDDVLKRLRQLAKNAQEIFLATDPDREGEAIASHIAQEISGFGKRIRRVEFHEITRSGVSGAMRNPRDIDEPMVRAQEARRVMDRLIGYKVSPYLWSAFRGEARGLSAGRVQSVALRLVVERERAIASFIPIEYWGLTGQFRTPKGEAIVARLVRHDERDLKTPTGSAADLDADAPRTFISTRKEAEDLRRRALEESYAISSIVRKEVKRNAPAPFTTSTLQQEAGRRLKMPTKKTMQLAQELYEGMEVGGRGRVGLITYMRTDSVRISDEAAAMAEEFIYENYGKEYLPGSRKAFAQKGKIVQDAHEAIRPTDLKITPKEARKHLDRDAAALYELIWNRFVASQMAPALIDQTTVDITGGPFVFRATGRITRFRGWLQVYGEDEPEESEGEKTSGKSRRSKRDAAAEEDESSDRALPESIREGDPLTLEKLDARQSFTKPPVRYTESLLVKELESRGIGRPSTYASIVSTIQERGYVDQRERRLYATELGTRVCDALVAWFPNLFEYRFTAKMEGDLDLIASGKATYLKVMQGFYGSFEKWLRAVHPVTGAPAAALPRASDGDRVRSPRRARTEALASDRVCPKCGAPMLLRNGRYGPFFSCTAFPVCRTTIPAPGGVTIGAGETPGVLAHGEVGSTSAALTASAEPAPRSTARRRKTGGATPRATSKRKDGSTRSTSGRGRSGDGAGSEEGRPCPGCGSPMVRRHSKGSGDFLGCSRYPECRHTEPLERGIACPSCHQGTVVRRKGGRYDSVFYGCSRYPDCRFTSSHQPVLGICNACGNEWLVEIDSPVEGKYQECPRCRQR